MKDLEFGIENDVDWIALSFVRKASDIQEIKAIINAANSQARVVAKIEKPEALSNIDDVIAATDAGYTRPASSCAEVRNCSLACSIKCRIACCPSQRGWVISTMENPR